MKKLLSILIAAILTASVFTSCSSDDDSGNKFEAGWYWLTEDQDYKNGDKGKYYYLMFFDEEGYLDYDYDDNSKYYGRFDLYDDYIVIDEETEEVTSFNTPETIPLEKIYYKDKLPKWVELSYEELKAYVDNKKTYENSDSDFTILWSDLKKESERKYTWSN